MNSETWLKNRLEEKLQRNPSFSLRAFARLIKLSPSYLSRVLSGERKLSFKAATTISESLALNPKEKKDLYDLVLKDQSQLPAKKISQKKQEINNSMELTLEAFKIVSDWYHYGITQLFFVEGFKDDPIWIAKMLDIRPIEAKFALARLEKLGIIERDKNNKLIRTNTSLSTTNEVVSSGLRKFHKQILEKAIFSLEKDDIKERDITSITVAINEANLQKAKLEIKKFRKRLSSILEKGKKTRVYNLGIHLIPLSKNTEN